jgi:hypothetical protein
MPRPAFTVRFAFLVVDQRRRAATRRQICRDTRPGRRERNWPSDESTQGRIRASGRAGRGRKGPLCSRPPPTALTMPRRHPRSCTSWGGPNPIGSPAISPARCEGHRSRRASLRPTTPRTRSSRTFGARRTGVSTWFTCSCSSQDADDDRASSYARRASRSLTRASSGVAPTSPSPAALGIASGPQAKEHRDPDGHR